MKEGPNSKMAIVLVIVTILLATAFESFLLASNDNSDLTSHSDFSSRYQIDEPFVNSNLTSRPGDLDISSKDTASVIGYTTTGMRFDFHKEDDLISLSCDKNVDTVALSLNVLKAMMFFTSSISMEYNFSIYNNIYYIVNLNINFNSINITYIFLDEGIRTQSYGDLIYDSWSEMDILVHVENGFMGTGINGIPHRCPCPTSPQWQPKLKSLTIAPGDQSSLDRTLWLNSIQLGFGKEFRYLDGLRKTIVPDGKDFAFVLHLHADKAYPKQLSLMANLSKQYGLRSTYDAWVYADGQYYSMQDKEYLAALHALQDSGWDIGVHAVSSGDLNRSQVISGIDTFTKEFGAPRTWSDHGYREQDLCLNGTNMNSTSYDADIIINIGAAWFHGYHGTSDHNDLNHDGMSYQLNGQESLPLFHVSRNGAWDVFGECGRQENVSEYLRSVPQERSMFVLHEYLPDFFYVKNDSGTYSILPEHDGIDFFPWTDLVSKKVFTNDSWYVEPRFQGFLNWTQGYNVWFTSVRDIYDRSEMIEKVSVSDELDRVVVRNQGDNTIKGFTLFTKSQPDFQLLDGDVKIDPMKGNADSWHFVIDLPGGAEVILTKKYIDDNARIWDSMVPFSLFMNELVMNDPHLK